MSIDLLDLKTWLCQLAWDPDMGLLYWGCLLGLTRMISTPMSPILVFSFIFSPFNFNNLVITFLFYCEPHRVAMKWAAYKLNNKQTNK